MNVKSIRVVLTLAAALVMTASLSFAGSWFSRSSTKSFDVTLAGATKLNNGRVLAAGNYTMKVPEQTRSPEVQFYKDGKLVAKAQAKVKTQPRKNEYTEILTAMQGKSNVITAIEPGGWAERLVFGKASGQKRS